MAMIENPHFVRGEIHENPTNAGGSSNVFVDLDLIGFQKLESISVLISSG